MISSIQLLRFIAAIAVVFYHIYAVEERYFKYQVSSGIFSFGNIGVDIFFIISGFIITHTISVRDNYSYITFLFKRLTRIVPLYWIITIAVYLFSNIFPSIVNSSYDSEPSLLCSLFFIPNKVNPIVNVGWSLNYEIWFYMLILLSLITIKGVSSTFFMIYFVLIILYDYNDSIFLNFILNDYNILFIIGVFIRKVSDGSCLLYQNKHFVMNIILLTLVLFFCILNQKNTIIISTFLFIIFIILNKILMNFKISCKLFNFLGDISYSLYLTHVCSLNLYFIILLNLDLNFHSFPKMTVIGCVLFCNLVSLVTYIYVDSKINLFFKSIYIKNKEYFD